MMKRLTLIVLVSFFAVCCRKPAQVDERKLKSAVPMVQIQEIKPHVWHQTIRSFGRIEAAEKVTISAEVSGKVNEVLFAQGDKIVSGQKLISFDVSESRMRLKQAEGNLTGVTAQLNEAKSMFSRREGLFKQRAISKEQLDSARTGVATLQAQYEQLMAGRSLARHHMRRTKLQSPVSGTVVAKGVDVGEVAMPGQSLAVIHVTDTMRVITWVTQEEINTVRTGTRCTVATNGVRGRMYAAHVESVGNEADAATGNFPVRLTVNNSDGLLKAGMSAAITLTGLEVNDAILIPDSAVVDRNRKRVVYLVLNGKAKEVEPVLAATSGSVRTVLHGISNGDQVIVGGLDDVADGSEVKVAGVVPLNASPTAAADETQPQETQPQETQSQERDSSAKAKKRSES